MTSDNTHDQIQAQIEATRRNLGRFLIAVSVLVFLLALFSAFEGFVYFELAFSLEETIQKMHASAATASPTPPGLELFGIDLDKVENRFLEGLMLAESLMNGLAWICMAIAAILTAFSISILPWNRVKPRQDKAEKVSPEAPETSSI